MDEEIKINCLYQQKDTKEKVQVIAKNGAFVKFRYLKDAIEISVANTRFKKAYERIEK